MAIAQSTTCCCQARAVWDLVPQLRGGRRGDSRGDSACRGRRCPVRRSFRPARRSSATLQERDLNGEDLVALVLDGKTFAESTMVVALGITLTGEKRFLGFVETDTENEKVLTPFLGPWSSAASTCPRVSWSSSMAGRDSSGRPERLRPPRPGPTMSMAQARTWWLRGRATDFGRAASRRLQPSEVRPGPRRPPVAPAVSWSSTKSAAVSGGSASTALTLHLLGVYEA